VESPQQVPQYVFDALRALPRDSHPMVMLSVGISACRRTPSSPANYNSGKFNKKFAWEYVYEDASTWSPALRSSPRSSTT